MHPQVKDKVLHVLCVDLQKLQTSPLTYNVIIFRLDEIAHTWVDVSSTNILIVHFCNIIHNAFFEAI